MTAAGRSERAPLWVADSEAVECLPLATAIDLLAAAHTAYAKGAATNMGRTHTESGEAILHAVGGVVGDVAGTKTWIYTPGGAQPLLVLFRVSDGSLLGVVEAFGLGKIRTAATSGLAARVLGRHDADVLGLLGTGKQALSQAEAVAEVRPLREIRVYGREPGKRADLAERLADRFSQAAVTEHDAVETALDGASLVTTITRARSPIVSGEMLAAGAHVNAVGAIVPTRAELEPSAVGRCGVVAADSVPQAREDSAELLEAEAAGLLRWDAVVELGAILAGERDGRRNDEQITLFKSLGVGLADVALGAEVLRLVAEAGAGRELNSSAMPRLTLAATSNPKEG